MSEVLQYAVRLLSRREYSVGELSQKLERKWPDSDGIQATLDRLVEEGMVCDARFAEAFVRSRQARQQGPRKIRAELRKRAVADSVTDAAIDAAGVDWAELAREWLQRQSVAERDYDARARYYRRLVNRGFTHDQALNALGDWVERGDGV